MDLSRHILVGLALLTLPVDLTLAADPEPQPVGGPAMKAVVTSPPGADMAQAILPAQTCSAINECCPNCSTAPCGAGVIGGVGLYLIQPYFSDNVAYGLQATGGRSSGPIPPGSPGVRTDTRVDINHHMEAAPLVWLGYMSDDGLGVRARWWYFREGSDQSASAPTGQGASSVTIFSGAPLGLSLVSGQSMNVTSKLELQAADLEALYDIRACSWDLLLAGGLRLASINQTYNAFVPQSSMNALLSSNYFEGVGPTLSLEARRALGTTGLSLYANGRGSVVFGSAHQVATVPDQSEVAQDHRDVGMAIGEVELGLEYGRNIGQSRLFGQVGLVGQQWFGAGSASRSSVNVVPGGMFVGAAYTADSDIEFFGLALRLGVNY